MYFEEEQRLQEEEENEISAESQRSSILNDKGLDDEIEKVFNELSNTDNASSEMDSDPERTDVTGKEEFLRHLEETDPSLLPFRNIANKLQNPGLNLDHYDLADKATIALGESFKINSTVTNLSLRDNFITPVGIEPLLNSLNHNSNLSVLDLSNNLLGSKAYSKVIGPMLAEVLRQNDTLKKLFLKKNKLSSQDTGYICQALTDNFTLLSLDLSYNDLGSRAGTALDQMLDNNSSLTELNLEWNMLGNEGAIALFNGLKNNNVVQVIKTAWNGIGAEATYGLKSALQHNSKLIYLDISNNRINSSGASEIAKGIQENSGITEFFISHNPLQATGVYNIINGLKDNSNGNIEFVDMRNCKASVDKPDSDKEINQEELRKNLMETLQKHDRLKEVLYS